MGSRTHRQRAYLSEPYRRVPVPTLRTAELDRGDLLGNDLFDGLAHALLDLFVGRRQGTADDGVDLRLQLLQHALGDATLEFVPVGFGGWFGRGFGWRFRHRFRRGLGSRL